MSYHDFDASYVLMRIKIGKIVALHVVPYYKRSKICVWAPKCLVIKLRYLKQTPNLFYRLTSPVVQVRCLRTDAQIT
jgi:hypothetical protein